ncbi:ankyrin repeat domain containing protein [Metarhizium album ARSEF 1941]|uniref:Ankyrin repeat domain containing protein n=1 Tax=Metarhizium album (strain ARSEF 1941) TaxID=1081103 RepID=A0A0B2WS87_METAS|nr:ankyrin repeat domain containing protein [Metarhizium album ARSEF 1941]KHN96499.1 ankyrin repeat domain containing protein [Metarhizium album ARSEF 1941]
MPADEEVHEGASTKELLIEACRRNNTDLLADLLAGRPDAEITALLNTTTTVMGNHLYHEAASHGNYEVIDLLLDQPSFECDPVNRLEGDTPLHSAVRWLNAEPPAQRAFGKALVEMMLEAGSNPRVRNKGGLTALQLVDPRNLELRQLIQQHEYTNQNAGDFVTVDAAPANKTDGGGRAAAVGHEGEGDGDGDDDDDDAEFSGSDEEERAEWERRRRDKRR